MYAQVIFSHYSWTDYHTDVDLNKLKRRRERKGADGVCVWGGGGGEERKGETERE